MRHEITKIKKFHPLPFIKSLTKWQIFSLINYHFESHPIKFNLTMILNIIFGEILKSINLLFSGNWKFDKDGFQFSTDAFLLWMIINYGWNFLGKFMPTFAWRRWPSFMDIYVSYTEVENRSQYRGIVEARDGNERTLTFSRLFWLFPIYKSGEAGSPGRVQVGTEIVALHHFTNSETRDFANLLSNRPRKNSNAPELLIHPTHFICPTFLQIPFCEIAQIGSVGWIKIFAELSKSRKNNWRNRKFPKFQSLEKKWPKMFIPEIKNYWNLKKNQIWKCRTFKFPKIVYCRIFGNIKIQQYTIFL